MEPTSVELTAGDPQDLLRRSIQTLMQHFAAKDKLGQFSRLYLMELVNPTGLIKDAWHEMIEPQRRMLHNIIRAIIGPEADELSILCELSIANQCRALVTIKNSDLKFMLGRPLSPELIDRLARHIADFSLAGIRRLAKARPDDRSNYEWGSWSISLYLIKGGQIDGNSRKRSCDTRQWLFCYAALVRSGFRNSNDPDQRFNFFGFRVARDF